MAKTYSQAIWKALAKGRTTGAYELSGRDLEEVPEPLYNNEIDVPDGDNCNWWEYAEPSKINLSRNSLASIPDGLGVMTTITVLDISYNPLESKRLPDCLSSLRNLKVLLATHCDLEELAQPLLQLPYLAKLDASHNRLQALPAKLGGEQPLAELLLAHNQLKELPDAIGSAYTLISLDVSSNKLISLPADLFRGATNLRTLDASNNQLQGPLPPAVSCLRKLSVLNLRGNCLSALPGRGALAGCSSLVELHLGLNALRELPEEVGHIDTLRLLDLSRNALEVFPKGCCNLRLSTLDLSNNELGQLPPELGLMTTLRALKLEGNPLRTMRQNLLTGPPSALLEALRSKLPQQEEMDEAVGLPLQRLAAAKRAVEGASSSPGVVDFDNQPVGRFGGGHSVTKFGGQRKGGGGAGQKGPSVAENPIEVVLPKGNLTKLPDDVEYLAEYLVKLDLSSNKLAAIAPCVLSRAGQLQVCMLPDNKLCSWPLPSSPPGCMPKLTHLNLARNPIGAIPPAAFTACPGLKVLDLSGVAAAATPGALAALEACPGLAEVSLVRCGLAQLPPQLLALASLTSLNLASNQLEELPGGVSRLAKLSFLDLTNNDLRSLPPELGRLHETLRVCAVDGNQIRTIRRPLLTGGTKALLEYLLTRISDTPPPQPAALAAVAAEDEGGRASPRVQQLRRQGGQQGNGPPSSSSSPRTPGGSARPRSRPSSQPGSPYAAAAATTTTTSLGGDSSRIPRPRSAGSPGESRIPRPGSAGIAAARASPRASPRALAARPGWQE